ncbi:hypothetical protein Sango_1896300 [Sesamum angolense]|uniref:Reverse transcriptase domain-containing protein n=1 Tax=Sesamum angolense TaxID=2727404 RepID=A0AAE1WIV1_9LAMI|nr:hypothetical protein Sango_1896300 [Sesamum angolense]
MLGRLITDNILLVQEMTHHLDMRHSKGNLILKLDMSNAYDRVKWKFLYAILEKIGFPTRFIALIKHAIEHCWFTILVNGEPSGFFKSSQGLIQGDPISPSLLILASEALFRGLYHLFSQNPDMFYQMGCKTRVTHLAYADDIIIFTRCTLHSLAHPNKTSNALVKNFWTNHSWDIDKLKEVVPQHIMELMLKIPINSQHQDVMHLETISPWFIFYKIGLGD